MSKLIKQLKEDKSVDLLYDSDEENEKCLNLILYKIKSQKWNRNSFNKIRV